MKNQKGLSTLEIILIVVLVVIISGIIWYFLVKSNSRNVNTSAPTSSITADNVPTGSISSTTASSTSQTTAINKDWKTYTNDNFKYSFLYPNTWKISDRCYDKNLEKWEDYDPKQWLAIAASTTDDKFPMCQSDFSQMNFIVRASVTPIDINGQMEQSDTDIESEEVINGIKWAKQIYTQPDEFDGKYVTYLYTNHNGKGYTISYPNSDNLGTHDSNIDEIIKNFKFND